MVRANCRGSDEESENGESKTTTIQPEEVKPEDVLAGQDKIIPNLRLDQYQSVLPVSPKWIVQAGGVW